MNEVTDDSFFLEGKVLKLNARGNVLVLFTSLTCGSCRQFEPILEEEIIPVLAKQKWMFGKYTKESNPELTAIKQSRYTNTPLAKSPTIILYSDGTPIGMKIGAADAPTMINFANTMLRSIQMPSPQQRQQQVPQQRPQQQKPQHRQQQIPSGPNGPPQRQQQANSEGNVRYSSSGVPIIDGFYGLPYNMGSTEEFLEYNAAYEVDSH